MPSIKPVAKTLGLIVATVTIFINSMIARRLLTAASPHLRLRVSPQPLTPAAIRLQSLSSSTSSTPSMDQPRSKPTDETEIKSTSTRPQALPAPPTGDDSITTLDVSGGGTTVKLDALGPLVVNEDGTMSRISNWAEMIDIEKQNTLRILGKRNQTRLAALKKARGIEDGKGEE